MRSVVKALGLNHSHQLLSSANLMSLQSSTVLQFLTVGDLLWFLDGFRQLRSLKFSNLVRTTLNLSLLRKDTLSSSLEITMRLRLQIIRRFSKRHRKIWRVKSCSHILMSRKACRLASLTILVLITATCQRSASLIPPTQIWRSISTTVTWRTLLSKKFTSLWKISRTRSYLLTLSLIERLKITQNPWRWW